MLHFSEGRYDNREKLFLFPIYINTILYPGKSSNSRKNIENNMDGRGNNPPNDESTLKNNYLPLSSSSSSSLAISILKIDDLELEFSPSHSIALNGRPEKLSSVVCPFTDVVTNYRELVEKFSFERILNQLLRLSNHKVWHLLSAMFFQKF